MNTDFPASRGLFTRTRAGLRVAVACAALAAGIPAQAGERIEFSGGAEEVPSNSPTSIPGNSFGSGGGGSVPFVSPPSTSGGAVSRRKQQLLDRQSNWIFQTPDDLPTAEEALGVKGFARGSEEADSGSSFWFDSNAQTRNAPVRQSENFDFGEHDDSHGGGFSFGDYYSTPGFSRTGDSDLSGGSAWNTPSITGRDLYDSAKNNSGRFVMSPFSNALSPGAGKFDDSNEATSYLDDFKNLLNPLAGTSDGSSMEDPLNRPGNAISPPVSPVTSEGWQVTSSPSRGNLPTFPSFSSRTLPENREEPRYGGSLDARPASMNQPSVGAAQVQVPPPLTVPKRRF